MIEQKLRRRRKRKCKWRMKRRRGKRRVTIILPLLSFSLTSRLVAAELLLPSMASLLNHERSPHSMNRQCYLTVKAGYKVSIGLCILPDDSDGPTHCYSLIVFISAESSMWPWCKRRVSSFNEQSVIGLSFWSPVH